MKYKVIRPWQGVQVGQIIDLDSLHPSLRANVTAVGGEVSDDTGPTEKLLEAAREEAALLLQKTEAELSQKAAEVMEGAKAEAQAIVDAANGEAQRIVDGAKTEAQAILDAANAAKASTVTPATPAAGTDGKGKGSKESGNK